MEARFGLTMRWCRLKPTVVQPLLNGYPRKKNGQWPHFKEWSLNGGKNKRKAIIRTLITGHLTGLTI